MKKKTLFMICTAALLATACVTDYRDYTFRGILYADSTLQGVIPNADMTFAESGGAKGRFSSDAQGRWGFSFIRNLDNPYQKGAKFQFAEYSLYVMCGTDTVFYEILPVGGNGGDAIVAYPGFMERLRSHLDNHNDSI